MPTSLSHDRLGPPDAFRIARAAVLNGVPIPARIAATLEARGVNVGELEQRLRHTLEFVR